MEPKGPDRSEWVFETGDPSVGIFGDYWIHEACPVPEPEVGDIPEVEVTEIASERVDDQTVRRLFKLHCPACGQSTEATSDEWDPTDEAMDRIEADWNR